VLLKQTPKEDMKKARERKGVVCEKCPLGVKKASQSLDLQGSRGLQGKILGKKKPSPEGR